MRARSQLEVAGLRVPGPDGTTRDPISIYRHGRDGLPESAWSYILKAMLSDRPHYLGFLGAPLRGALRGNKKPALGGFLISA